MKLFASDYDGTLFQQEKIDQHSLQMIEQFRSQGNLFVIATGRSIGSVLSEANIHQIPFDYIIGNNGSLAINNKEDVIFIRLMDFGIAVNIVENLPKKQVSYYGVSDGFNVGLHDVLLKEERQYNNIIDMSELLKNQHAVGIFVRFRSADLAKKYAKTLNQEYPFVIKAYNFFDYVDILNYGVTKKTGIENLVDYLGVQPKIFTMGDSFNDIPMVKGFNGFAVTDGEDDVKKVASQSFETVGKALEYVLENE